MFSLKQRNSKNKYNKNKDFLLSFEDFSQGVLKQTEYIGVKSSYHPVIYRHSISYNTSQVFLHGYNSARAEPATLLAALVDYYNVSVAELRKHRAPRWVS